MEVIVWLSVPFFQVGVLENGHVHIFHLENRKKTCVVRFCQDEKKSLFFPIVASALCDKILLSDSLSWVTFLKEGWRLFGYENIDFSSILCQGVCSSFTVKERMKAGLQFVLETDASGYSSDHVKSLM